MKKSELVERKAEAVEKLRELCPQGTRVYTNLQHRARSGMLRIISVHIVKDGSIMNISGWVKDALEMKIDPKWGGLKVHGCGLDVGHHVVYNLSACLYGHEDRGGYALSHEWL